MKRPAIFFDRDNTLIVSDGYLGDPAQVKLMDGAAHAVARARVLGYAVVVISNQSGVARGLFTEDDVHAVNARLDQVLKDANPDAVIDRHEFCPFHPDATLEEYRRDSDLRKPKPGMLFAAAERLGLDLSRSWVIGDAPRDIEAAHAAGCRAVFLLDPTRPPSPAAQEPFKQQPDKTVSNLREAIDYIEEVSEPVHQRVTVQPVGRDRAAAGARPADVEEEASPEEHFAATLTRLERLAEQILHELRRRRDEPVADFSLPRLLAGIMQVITLAILLLSYLNRAHVPTFQSLLLLALVFQTFTIALLIMGRLR